jgi:Cu/Ag efflux protein CusF
MKDLKKPLVAVTMLAMLGGSGLALAQMNHGDMGTMTTHAADQASMTDGEVKKIDREQAKLTIKHGDIKNLDMPGMTMVFLVKDKSYLDKVKVGDKIKFTVMMENGKMVITEIRAAR